MAGGFDTLLKTRVADVAACREFIGSVICTLPGVRETRTCAVMEEVRNDALLPMRSQNRLHGPSMPSCDPGRAAVFPVTRSGWM